MVILGILHGSVLSSLDKRVEILMRRGYIPSSRNRERLERLCGTECLTKKISISKCEEIHLSWWGRQSIYRFMSTSA